MAKRLVLLVWSFFVLASCRSGNSVIDVSTTPAIPTIPATATSTLAPAPCTFPLAQTTSGDAMPEEYVFSEPQVVLTAERGNTYNIVEWLPDNRQVLMTEDLRNLDIANDTPLQESIWLYDPEGGQTKLYAMRPLTYDPPSWLPELNAVVYPAMNYTSYDRQKGLSKFTRQIRISEGNPDITQVIADNLVQIPFAIKPGGQEILYLSDQKLSRLDKTLKNSLSVSIDFEHWDYAKERRDDQPFSYKMAWQPGTSLVFVYSWAGGTQGGGYTFILNAETGQVCELHIGGWAERAHWSSDGRYLAFIRSATYSGFAYSTDLVVLDTATGNLDIARIVPQDLRSEYHIDDFTWAPDNRHLLALAHPRFQDTSPENTYHDLYLVDIIADQSVQLFPEFKSFIANGAPGNNLAWSPNGEKLLIRCPADRRDRICLVHTQRTEQ